MGNRISRRSIGTGYSMRVQPAFMIGTNNEDGSHNFAPITWVSITNERDDEYDTRYYLWQKYNTYMQNYGVLMLSSY